MKKRTLSGLIVLLIGTGLWAQSTLNGVSIAGSLKAGDKTLTLNGAGIRKKMMMSIYVGSLYVTAKSQDGPSLAKANDPMVMRINITSGMVTSDRMYEATLDGFKKSTGGKMAPLQDKINRFLGLFKKEEIKNGDYFDIAYLPSSGVNVSKNGKLLETIQGADFKAALFGIWIGSDPVDEGLKEGLLGKSN